jgi:hypothetical protein
MAEKDGNMVLDATLRRVIGRRLPTAICVALSAAAVASVGGTSCGQVKTSDEAGGMSKAEDFVPGQIVVWFDDDLSDAVVDELVAKTGGEIIERSGVTPSRVVVAVPAGEEGRYVDAYRKLEEVRAAEKNHIFRALPEGGGSGDAEKYKIKSQ